MVREPPQRTRAIFLPDRGMAASAWQRWTSLFDENGYDAAVLRPGEDVDPGRALDHMLAAGGTTVVVGHGAGATAAIDVAHQSAARRWAAPPVPPQGEGDDAMSAQARRVGAVVAISPTRMSRWTSPSTARPHRSSHPGFAMRRQRLIGVPVLLVVGGREACREQAAVLRLETKLRRAARDDVTDRQVFAGLGHGLPVGDRWRDVAYFVLDWLTRQDL